MGGIIMDGPGSSDNVVSGNWIGLGPGVPTVKRSNARHGILLMGGASFNTIGGPDGTFRNVISANGYNGVRITDPATHANIVESNFIGSDAVYSADATLGNTWAGIRINKGAHDNLIGGLQGEGNRISYNLLSGVEVAGTPPPQDNAVLGNTILENTELGIDLGGTNTVSPNDPGDTDGGPNALLNFPELTSGFIAAGQLTLSYDLDVPAGDYRIEFYSSVQADPSGYGEGGQMLHAATVTHSGQGSQSFQTTFAFTGANWLTATATAIKSPNSYGNTSEFSLAIPANFQPARAQHSESASVRRNASCRPRAQAAPMRRFEARGRYYSWTTAISVQIEVRVA